jgi:GT2 family glycosyltransferase
MKDISIVIPLYKSEMHIYELVNYLNNSELYYKYNIHLTLMIDGCVQQYDFEKIKSISKNITSIRIYYLNQNTGQYFATIEGIKISCCHKCQKVITLDSDSYSVLDLTEKLDSAISSDCEVAYFELYSFDNNFIRKLGSFLFKIILFIKTGFKVFKNGSSIRIIDPEYYNRISHLILSPEQLDVCLINNSSNYNFIVAKTNKNTSSYSLSILFFTFINFSFDLKPIKNLNPILIKEFFNY